MDYRSGGLVGRWRAEGGYREFLGIALPLILSTASWSIQHFVDRVFLTWPSTEALAAALRGIAAAWRPGAEQAWHSMEQGWR